MGDASEASRVHSTGRWRSAGGAVRGLAQPTGRSYRVGRISVTDSFTSPEPYQLAFVQRLRELGFVEGRNLTIIRSAARSPAHLGAPAHLAQNGISSSRRVRKVPFSVSEVAPNRYPASYTSLPVPKIFARLVLPWNIGPMRNCC